MASGFLFTPSSDGSRKNLLPPPPPHVRSADSSSPWRSISSMLSRSLHAMCVRRLFSQSCVRCVGGLVRKSFLNVLCKSWWSLLKSVELPVFCVWSRCNQMNSEMAAFFLRPRMSLSHTIPRCVHACLLTNCADKVACACNARNVPLAMCKIHAISPCPASFVSFFSRLGIWRSQVRVKGMLPQSARPTRAVHRSGRDRRNTSEKKRDSTESQNSGSELEFHPSRTAKSRETTCENSQVDLKGARKACLVLQGPRCPASCTPRPALAQTMLLWRLAVFDRSCLYFLSHGQRQVRQRDRADRGCRGPKAEACKSQNSREKTPNEVIGEACMSATL